MVLAVTIVNGLWGYWFSVIVPSGVIFMVFDRVFRVSKVSGSFVERIFLSFRRTGIREKEGTPSFIFMFRIAEFPVSQLNQKFPRE